MPYVIKNATFVFKINFIKKMDFWWMWLNCFFLSFRYVEPKTIGLPLIIQTEVRIYPNKFNKSFEKDFSFRCVFFSLNRNLRLKML